jgi:hypothetical protein
MYHRKLLISFCVTIHILQKKQVSERGMSQTSTGYQGRTSFHLQKPYMYDSTVSSKH